MSERVAECTSVPPDGPPREILVGPPSVPPVVDPARWEDFPVFRETFLYYVTLPPYADALRTVGDWLFAMVLESYGQWPSWPESATRTEVRAALADLRHLEGFLGSVGREHVISSLAPEDAILSQLAATLAPQLSAIAVELATALDPEV
jgi:hypothetical protein